MMAEASQAEIVAAADRIRAAYAGPPGPPLRQLLPVEDSLAAHSVQEHNIRVWEAEGRRVVGYKTGLTSRAEQRLMGAQQPVSGVLYADAQLMDGEELPWGRLLQPRAGAGVAFVLSREVDREDASTTDLLRAIDHVLPAIELADSRIKDWEIDVVDAIADNGCAGAYFLGSMPRTLVDIDLRLCGMSLWRGGEPVSVGAGAACLGSPLNAAVWLARSLVRAGRPLRSGDVVLTGALGPMVPVSPGSALRAEIMGLGSVRAVFGPAGEVA